MTALKLNPAWKQYNDVMNEGGEGYNPHPKYIPNAAAATSATEPAIAKPATRPAARMIVGKLRTHADAIKFAKNCLSGAQKESFLAQTKAAFPELY